MDAQATGEAFSPQKRHPAIQNMNILYFFLFLLVIFALLDPDPDPATRINADPCGSGFATLAFITRLRSSDENTKSFHYVPNILAKWLQIFSSYWLT
jgi:hypothetical protein